MSKSILDYVYSYLLPDAKSSLPKSVDEPSQEKITGCHHRFEVVTLTTPTFCNYCKEFIWGITQQGYSCVVCKYVAHRRCVDMVPPSCNQAVKHGEEVINSLFEMKHNFTEGGITCSECYVCGEEFELLSFNPGLECTRCEKAVHKECLRSLYLPCRPRHWRLLAISPKLMVKYKSQYTNNTPLVCFINPKSGGQYGNHLIQELSRLLDKSQIFDLTVENGATRGLKKFRDIPNLRILVCGGDGTVGWVLSDIEKLGIEPFPPVGIIPLGTGNDLARSLGWGSGYSGEPISDILDRIEDSLIVHLDRWTVNLVPETSEVAPKTLGMNNYMSVGVDAEVTLEFHKLRNSRPELFTSQIVNKFWYAQYGARCMFSDIEELGDMIDLEVDGKQIDLPEGLGGIMILNLPSYAGGVNLWESDHYEEGFKKQELDDKIVEVVAITGSFHMGQITVKLSQPIRIAQGHSVTIKMYQKLPVQVDGEPFMQEPSTIHVNFNNQVRMLYKSNNACTFRSVEDDTVDDQLADYKRTCNILKSENDHLKHENMELKNEIESLRKQLSKQPK